VTRAPIRPEPQCVVAPVSVGRPVHYFAVDNINWRPLPASVVPVAPPGSRPSGVLAGPVWSPLRCTRIDPRRAVGPDTPYKRGPKPPATHSPRPLGLGPDMARLQNSCRSSATAMHYANASLSGPCTYFGTPKKRGSLPRYRWTIYRSTGRGSADNRQAHAVQAVVQNAR
jgi:hypothetical protein